MTAAPSTRHAPRLRRSKEDRVLGGVCGGLGTYLNVDPLWFRIGFIALSLGGGTGVVLYIIGWIAIAEESDTAPIVPLDTTPNTGGLVVGSILIVVGTIALLNRYIPQFNDIAWPLVLIAVGGMLLIRRSRA